MKRLVYIFIPFLAILLMSHNASAINLNIPVSRVNSYSPVYWSYRVNNTWANFTMSTVTRDYDDANVGGIAVKSNGNSFVNIKTGDYVEIRMMFAFRGSRVNLIDDYSPSQNTGFFDVRNGLSHNTEVVDMEWSTPQTYTSDSDGAEVITVYHVTITGRSQGNNSYPIFPIYIRSNVTGSGDAQLEFYVSDMTIYNVASDADREEEATQEASDQSQDAGDSSSSDAEQGSSSLISAIGGFVNAITSASPSNCNINGDMGNFDMGSIDLCANPVPTFVQIISSLVLIAICIPFAIIMFNRFIGMFRSFQG